MTPYPAFFCKIDDWLGGVMGRCVGQKETGPLHFNEYSYATESKDTMAASDHLESRSMPDSDVPAQHVSVTETIPCGLRYLLRVCLWGNIAPGTSATGPVF